MSPEIISYVLVHAPGIIAAPVTMPVIFSKSRLSIVFPDLGNEANITISLGCLLLRNIGPHFSYLLKKSLYSGESMA